MNLFIDDCLSNLINLGISIPDESRTNAYLNCMSIDKNALHETLMQVLVDNDKISTSYNR